MNRIVFWCSWVGLSIILSTEPVKAQAVVSDGTLNTIVTRSGNTFTINNGTTLGTNLFHSFREFSIPTGGSAIFNNATNIQNILSRVTGDTVSNIDGAIQANGTANLFLLNPAGILFGSGASLNIGGSFVGTTAQAIKFADGIELSAIAAGQPPLLTMSAPIGLQMGQNPAAIQVQNTGHRLAFPEPIFPPLQKLAPYSGLQVQPNRTLALIGGNLDFTGAILQASGGHIEIGSVAQPGLITLQADSTGFSTAYNNITNFGTVQLAQRSILEVSGSPSGSLKVQGGQVNIRDGSMLLGINSGSQSAGSMTISAAQGILLEGAAPTPSNRLRIPSSILQDNFGSAKGGDIIIQSPNLTVRSGAVLFSRNYGSAAGGDLRIKTQTTTLDGYAMAHPDLFSRIGSLTTSIGVGGNVSVSTQKLSILNGAFLGSVLFLDGSKGGNVQVNADTINVQGVSPALLISSLGANNLAKSGSSGTLDINTRTLSILESGFVGTTSISDGNAGHLRVQARESIVVQGSGDYRVPGSSNPIVIPSRLSSSVSPGDAIYRTLFGLPESPSGTSGNVEIDTPSLTVGNGAIISVSNTGTGRAGMLQIDANRLRIHDGGRINALAVSGDGGSITIRAQQVLMNNRAQIAATALGTNNQGNGGNITLDSDLIFGVNNSDILASASNGNGGNITITTQGIIGLKYRDRTTPENDITASSNFGVNGSVQINNAGVDPNSSVVILPTTLNDASQKIAKGCAATQGSSFVITGRGGVPTNPSERVNSDRAWADLRDLSNLQSQNPATDPQTTLLVEATNWQRNPQTGKVELIAAQPARINSEVTCAPTAERNSAQ
ncbi:filamentous hemagglutinin N-terminal domain-containing protein [Leptolyngbya boryana CZ1]|uniref:Filamentous hemagglutinin N-terminal domain-containing protein n=1 Tax=Leptolyngbya boryana CZ1 TaxID=3060204 RepID=A0AA96WRS3_LEPBY|nr:filamentous hemagglutinin N-terminal domain-containing protein [Leptolyngbya boryana]WNZ44532.1 filamentous hemagglutinin N-terminal domain-containing protein [Leptolyngbya boryana CZ1]